MLWLFYDENLENVPVVKGLVGSKFKCMKPVDTYFLSLVKLIKMPLTKIDILFKKTPFDQTEITIFSSICFDQII